MRRIAQDIADNDLYKFSMGQLAFSQFSKVDVRYRYTNRAKDKSFHVGFADELRQQVNMMADLRLNPGMYQYFKKNCPWLKDTYLQWLRDSFRFKPEQVHIEQDASGALHLGIEGPWYETIYWEVPLLYTISELSRTHPSTGTMMEKTPDWEAKILDKASRLADAKINWIDFGSRRRFSFEVEDKVCQIMKGRQFAPYFRGTSNPYLGYLHDLTPHGTAAHELTMIMQAVYGLQQCNLLAMEHWVQEYHGDLGIALMDTITTPKFLEVFDSFYARLFDGVRQDSGDPIKIGEMVIAHYEKLRIDPTTKILVFSDGLTVDKCIEIAHHFSGRIRMTMGIGTHLTNDVGYPPSNHVIKVIEANPFGISGRIAETWVPLLKFPDERGKTSGTDEMVAMGMKILRLS